MKFKITNLGPIKEAEIDLKPLTIFIGPNNTGKTYASVSIYRIFHLKFAYQAIDVTENIKELEMNGVSKINFADYVFSRIPWSFGSFNANVDWLEWLSDKISPNILVEISEFSNAEILIIKETIKDLIIAKNEEDIKLKGDVLINVRKETGDENIILEYFLANKKIPEADFHNAIFSKMRDYFDKIIRSIFPKPKIFPAQRTSLLLSYRDYYALLSKNDDIKSKGSVYPQYIKDFYDDILYSFPGKPIAMKTTEVWKPKGFNKIASFIETEILGGKILTETKFENAPPDFYFEFNPSKPPIPIRAAATGVQQLTFLVSYLKHEAEADRNMTVFIDEPEINLHPQAQVKLAEAFAMMINAGLKLVISTHTPYIIDHLNNLLACERVARKKESKVKDIRKQMSDKLQIPEERWLKPEDVAAYHFHHEDEKDPTSPVKVDNIFSKKGAEIQWHSFSNVSENISEIDDIILDFDYSEDSSNQ